MAFFVLQAHAQDTPTSPVEPTKSNVTDQETALKQVSEELNNRVPRWYGLMRIKAQNIQKISAGLGAMYVKQAQHADCSVACSLQGWHFEVEPGLYGVQGGIGWGKLVGETGGTRRLLHTLHFGWNLRGVVLRTWGDSSLYPQSQTLAGVEGSVSIIRLNFSLGLLRSLYSGPEDESADDWVITAGIGWGF